MSQNRVLVIGLDGATFDLIGPWIDAGDLPHLRALRDTGASGVLESVFPPLTPCAWPSFYTGKNPGKHGLFGYKVRRRGTYEEIPLSASDRKGRTLFELIGDQGRKVAVLSVPMTYPATPVEGVLVTCLFTPKVEDIYRTACAWPAEFKEEMKRVIGTFRIHTEHTYAKGRIEDLLADYRGTLEQRVKLLLHVMAHHPWDFAITVLNETDHIQHQIWHVIDPAHHRHDEREAGASGGAMKSFWKDVDARLGEVLRATPPDTTVIVLSDHGHGPIYWWIHLNNFLAKKGYIRFRRRPLTFLKRLLFRLGVTPANVWRILQSLGLLRRKKGGGEEGAGSQGRLVRRFFLSEDDIDWKRTRAWAVGHMGQINVNLAGREPSGIVKKSEVPELRRSLEADLLGIRDPASGKSVVRRLAPREDLFHGEFVTRASDFFIETVDPGFQALGGASFISNRVIERSYGNSATHRMNGIFLARGPWIRPGSTITDARITDMAAMILHTLGLRIPEDMDGRIHPEILKEGVLAAHPPVTMPLSEVKSEDRSRDLSPEEIALMNENLRRLGYVD